MLHFNLGARPGALCSFSDGGFRELAIVWLEGRAADLCSVAEFSCGFSDRVPSLGGISDHYVFPAAVRPFFIHGCHPSPCCCQLDLSPLVLATFHFEDEGPDFAAVPLESHEEVWDVIMDLAPANVRDGEA